MTREETKKELKDIKHRLGPYAQLSGSEPFRVNDAEIVRLMCRLIDIVDRLVDSK